jgi:phage-related protein
VFEIIFYKKSNGKQPIKEYLAELGKKSDKDSRIKFAKIAYYLQALSEYGTQAGEPYVKHIDAEIWELRPLRDRFFFFCWKSDRFVLLHHFVKKTQKTPKREIEQAKKNLKDYIERSRNNEQK